MYRFLATSRWIGFAVLTVVMAVIMVGLGFWQLDRFHSRADSNSHVDAVSEGTAVPATSLMGIGRPPSKAAAWTKVTVTGQYDPAHQIIARERTLNSQVGFEIIDPLKLSNGTAVLVDRGWLAPAASGAALTLPDVPPTPTGKVTVTGLLHLPESKGETAIPVDGKLTVRRIAPAKLASVMPYPLLGGYVAMEAQQPSTNAAAFGQIPVDHQDSTLNAGYVVQWWCFALIALVGFGWTAYREAHPKVSDLDLAGLGTAEHPDAPVSPAV
ncbi:SURF1 family protein [Rugosimonospora acidiphila]|uniref:SURF1-like protein n=1 Tax=Rugosimonospora acidiphila TaxID=556531 RepID=A0ABP9RQ49_9ACTN